MVMLNAGVRAHQLPNLRAARDTRLFMFLNLLMFLILSRLDLFPVGEGGKWHGGTAGLGSPGPA